jgi:hypothetical protein
MVGTQQVQDVIRLNAKKHIHVTHQLLAHIYYVKVAD